MNYYLNFLELSNMNYFMKSLLSLLAPTAHLGKIYIIQPTFSNA